VTDQQDPVRWSEAESDAGPKLRELFRSAAFDVPSDAQLQALRARLPDPPAGPPPGTGGKSGLLGSGGRALAVTAAIGGLAALVAVVGLRSGERPAETTAPPMASSSTRLVEPVPAPPSPNAGVTAPSEPTAAVPAPSASSASSARAKTPNEAALLERARRALSSNPALALELTRRHQTEFPRGVLRQEREVIAIEALRRLGKADQARERGSDFRREFPDSPHGRAVDRGLVP
jgi:hypothetical protein